MADFLVNYLMIDRIGCVAAIAVVALVFAGARHAWQATPPQKKPSDG